MQSCLYIARPGRPILRTIGSLQINANRLLPLQSSKSIKIRFEHNGRPGVHDAPLAVLRNAPPKSREETSSVPLTAPEEHNFLLEDTDQPKPNGASIRYLTGRTPTTPALWRPSRWSSRQHTETRSPPATLAQYLDLKDDTEKNAYWNDIKLMTSVNSLPMITIHYLYTSTISESRWDENDHAFRKEAITYLHSRKLSVDDVAQWAWVLSAERSDEVVERFLSLSLELPTFLLLEVLRKDIHYVGNLKKLLLYAWNYLLERCPKSKTSEGLVLGRPAPTTIESMEENAFTTMISRLLSQTRRLWPAAMVSVARMVSPFVHSLLDCNAQNQENLDARMHARICRLSNYILPLLALPASIEPHKSMIYNWSAQKALLELAGEFNPPLMLDKDSYKAVIQVQAASKKTELESKVAKLRMRTWPPWRTEQDGMDAQRAPDDDLSRVLVATMRSREAGYRPTPHDLALKIVGGQEVDGTPTIQTRKLIKWRATGRTRKASTDFDPTFDQSVWAARVEATRDIREAWRAFVAFQDVGGRPNLTLYLAMFKKLNFEEVRQGRKSDYVAAPGDGKEVLPVPDDNMSDFYKTHTQPPTLDELYKHMLSTGLRPSGQCLSFLVRHARTPSKGVNYLRESGLESTALKFLTGGHNTRYPHQKPFPDVLKNVNGALLGAYIHLICRFAPRAVLAVPNGIGMHKLEAVASGRSETTELETLQKRQWCIQELEKSPHPRLRDPLHHAARILNEEQSRSRLAWYSLFEGLARRNVVMSRKHVGGSKNNEVAWKSTEVALRNFQACGLELDPYGFVLVCNSFFKFGESVHHVLEEHQAVLLEGARLLKCEFAKLSRSEESPYWIPKLLHNIKSVTLHIYVRCMGLVGDHDETISVLEWMVQHRAELQEIDAQSRNGFKMLARTLVAARLSCYGTRYEERAMNLVRQVDGWQWPDDRDLEQYLGGSNVAQAEGN